MSSSSSSISSDQQSSIIKKRSRGSLLPPNPRRFAHGRRVKVLWQPNRLGRSKCSYFVGTLLEKIDEDRWQLKYDDDAEIVIETTSFISNAFPEGTRVRNYKIKNNAKGTAVVTSWDGSDMYQIKYDHNGLIVSTCGSDLILSKALFAKHVAPWVRTLAATVGKINYSFSDRVPKLQSSEERLRSSFPFVDINDISTIVINPNVHKKLKISTIKETVINGSSCLVIHQCIDSSPIKSKEGFVVFALNGYGQKVKDLAVMKSTIKMLLKRTKKFEIAFISEHGIAAMLQRKNAAQVNQNSVLSSLSSSSVPQTTKAINIKANHAISTEDDIESEEEESEEEEDTSPTKTSPMNCPACSGKHRAHTCADYAK